MAKKCPECPSIPKWMTTFSDLMSLLLTFFVLLLTMATMDKTKIEAAFGILNGGKGIFDSASDTYDMDPIIKKQQKSAVSTQEQTLQEVKDYLEAQQSIQQMVSVIKTNKGFTVRIMDSVFFDTGSATIMRAAYPVLDSIAAAASNSPFYLNIEGHTDDSPAGRNQFGNWDISNERALAVLKYFITQGVPPEKLSATGFGEYHPLLPNITAENRAKNRRVEINFISPEFFETGKKLE